MTQQLADLAERGAVAQHLGGQSMAKLMCSCGRGVNAGALKRMPNDRSNATWAAKAADRGFGAQKYAATVATWSSVPQIRGDRFADVRGKGRSLRWPLLPRTLNCPAFQSISSSSRNATSPERNPSRASRSKMA